MYFPVSITFVTFLRIVTVTGSISFPASVHVCVRVRECMCAHVCSHTKLCIGWYVIFIVLQGASLLTLRPLYLNGLNGPRECQSCFFLFPLVCCVQCRGMYMVLDRMSIDDFFFNLQDEWSVHRYVIVCIHVHTHTRTLIVTHAHMRMHTHTLTLTHTHTHTHAHAHTHTCTRTHTHMHTPTHTHPHTHTHTHTHTHHLLPSPCVQDAPVFQCNGSRG